MANQTCRSFEVVFAMRAILNKTGQGVASTSCSPTSGSSTLLRVVWCIRLFFLGVLRQAFCICTFARGELHVEAAVVHILFGGWGGSSLACLAEALPV